MTHKETFEEVKKHIKIIMEQADKLTLPEHRSEIYMNCNAILDFLNEKKKDEQDGVKEEMMFQESVEREDDKRRNN